MRTSLGWISPCLTSYYALLASACDFKIKLTLYVLVWRNSKNKLWFKRDVLKIALKGRKNYMDSKLWRNDYLIPHLNGTWLIKLKLQWTQRKKGNNMANGDRNKGKYIRALYAIGGKNTWVPHILAFFWSLFIVSSEIICFRSSNCIYLFLPLHWKH